MPTWVGEGRMSVSLTMVGGGRNAFLMSSAIWVASSSTFSANSVTASSIFFRLSLAALTSLSSTIMMGLRPRVFLAVSSRNLLTSLDSRASSDTALLDDPTTTVSMLPKIRTMRCSASSRRPSR